MSLSNSKQFAAAASGPTKPKARKRPAPFPIRLSPDERAYLESKAGNLPLGTYIRSRLLSDAKTPRKVTRKPSIDAAQLGRMLGALGKSDQVACLLMLLAAAEEQRVSLEERERIALHDACVAIQEMRTVLIKAMGLRS